MRHILHVDARKNVAQRYTNCLMVDSTLQQSCGGKCFAKLGHVLAQWFPKWAVLPPGGGEAEMA